LAGAVTYQHFAAGEQFARRDEQVPCSLGCALIGRVQRDPGERHPSGWYIDEEEQVEPFADRGVNGDEIAGGGRLGAQERSP
jgi:hypothetical protein